MNIITNQSFLIRNLPLLKCSYLCCICILYILQGVFSATVETFAPYREREGELLAPISDLDRRQTKRATCSTSSTSKTGFSRCASSLFILLLLFLQWNYVLANKATINSVASVIIEIKINVFKKRIIT